MGIHAELERALKRHRDHLLAKQHVVGVGLAVKERARRPTGDLAIQVFVVEKKPMAALSEKDRVPPILAGHPTDVVATGRFRALAAPRTARVRPAVPGVSIAHYKVSAGTFGAVVRDAATGEPLILSNNHVLANSSNGRDGRAAIGDPVLQPGPYDQGTVQRDVIGRLIRFVPLSYTTNQTAGRSGRLRRGFRRPRPNFVDAAVARPLQPNMTHPEIAGLGRVRGTRTPEIGLPVQKSGRSSGVTRGVLRAVNVSVEVALSDDAVALFEDQLLFTRLGEAGDSGALIVDGKNHAIGLLFAGSNEATLGNPIGPILERLRVRL